MFKILLLLLFILFSCKYPDIDSMPRFDALNVSLEETLDKCRIKNRSNNSQTDCDKAQKQIIDRL